MDGANTSAVVYMMVEMAKNYELNIFRYLEYLLEQWPDSSWRDEELVELVPWSEKFQFIKNGREIKVNYSNIVLFGVIL